MKESAAMREAYDELTLATRDGFKSKHDDFIDTISMLAFMHYYKPSKDTMSKSGANSLWSEEVEEEDYSIGSYVE